MVTPKEEIVKALQDLKTHVGGQKDAAHSEAGAAIDPAQVKPWILHEIELVLDKLIQLLTGGGSTAS